MKFGTSWQLFRNLRIEAAISAVLLLAGLAAAMHVNIPAKTLLLCFFGAWAMYILDAETSVSPEDRFGNAERFNFFAKHERAIRILIGSLIGVSVVIAATDWRAMWRVKWQLLVMGILCASYVTPALPFVERWPKLKNRTPFKTVAIPLAWLIGATALIRAFGPGFVEAWLRFEHWLPLLFFFLLLDTLVLDWMDRKTDRVAGVHSIPVDNPRLAVGLIGLSYAVVVLCSYQHFGWRGMAVLSAFTTGIVASLRFSRAGVEIFRIAWLAAFWYFAHSPKLW